MQVFRHGPPVQRVAANGKWRVCPQLHGRFPFRSNSIGKLQSAAILWLLRG